MERRLLRVVRTGVACFILLFLVITGCATLQMDYAKSASYALKDPDTTALGRRFASERAKKPGESGFYILSSGMDAFVARVLLTEAAERTLDLQYYIIQDDLTTAFLAERLIRAAERGVRVRLLVDDMGGGIKDFEVTLFAAHPNIEVRLFNPFSERQSGFFRLFEMLGNYGRVNRRMHNKMFVADNQAAIIGGRNLADEYFQARPDVNFADLDLLAVGPIVRDISASFDEYWNSDWAIPIGAFVDRQPTKQDLEEKWKELQKRNAEAKDSDYARALRQTDLIRQLEKGKIPLAWAEGQVVCDRPGKIADLEQSDPSLYLGPQLRPFLESTQKELILISPYFVPGRDGVKILEKMRKRGAAVRILTNSLAATDVAAVHSGYARYRKDLLKLGIELYEMRPTPSQKRKMEREEARVGSSRASLHAKSFIFDRQTIFVGSKNLDPRSAYLNTEIGLVVKSPELARQLVALFEEGTQPQRSFRLDLRPSLGGDDSPSPDQYLVWVTEEKGEEVYYENEPMAGVWRRFSAWFLSLLPVEKQL
ncbi:MAG: hypothetical protein AMJ94_03785 [Deltaproteobacteria bacterium SM23_61]|nr:MAG: hypothetical protein AMJ94_03785 [Deltaproteobacteria bacterium SM23_61]